MTILTDKQQTMIRTIPLAAIATPGAHLTGLVGFDFDGYRTSKRRFVRNDAVQLRKGQLGGILISTSLLRAGFLASYTFRPFSDVCQVFQTDDGFPFLPFIGQNNSTLLGEKTYSLPCLKFVVVLVVVREGRRDVARGMIKSLIGFLGLTCFAQCYILSNLYPQGFICGSHLSRDISGHLCRQVEVARSSARALLDTFVENHRLS